MITFKGLQQILLIHNHIQIFTFLTILVYNGRPIEVVRTDRNVRVLLPTVQELETSINYYSYSSLLTGVYVLFKNCCK